MVMTLLVAAAASGGANQGDMALHPEHISVALPSPRLEINERWPCTTISQRRHTNAMAVCAWISSSHLAMSTREPLQAGTR